MAIEVLDGSKLTRSERRLLRNKRLRCRINGHMWQLESFVAPSIYNLYCVRCFPHIKSRRQVVSYNLFATPNFEEVADGS